jgi:hypothetical protein
MISGKLVNNKTEDDKALYDALVDFEIYQKNKDDNNYLED